MLETIIQSKTLEIIFRGFSFTDDVYFIVPIIVLGYIFKSKEVFGKTLIIIMLSMLVNVCLKNYFGVPLKDWLAKEGYAFPSGHMQFASAFWLSLLWEYHNRWFVRVAVLILLGVAGQLLYFDYHSWHEILAGFFVGGLLVLGVNFLIQRYETLRENPLLLALILGGGGIALNLTLPDMTAKHVNHIWLAWGAMLGFGLGWQVWKSIPYEKHLKNDLIALGFAIIFAAGVTYGFKQIVFSTKALWTFTYYFSLALSLTLLPHLMTLWLTKKKSNAPNKEG